MASWSFGLLGTKASINHLIKDLKSQRIINLNAALLADAKQQLLGSYVIGRLPGTFEWQDGLLWTAVKQGQWLHFEDIEFASVDLLLLIQQIISDRSLYDSHNQRNQTVNPEFRILASTDDSMNFDNALLTYQIEHRLWNIIPKVTSTDATSTSLLSNELLHLLRRCCPMETSTDDFNRLCRIVSSFIPLSTSSDLKIQERLIIRKVCKILFGSHVDIIHLDNVLVISGQNCSISDDANSVQIGAFSVPKVTSSSLLNTKSNITKVQMTKTAMETLQALALGVLTSHPLLLIGETGTGKTTLVQHFADLVGQEVIVVNLSQQSESSDLLGGYKPATKASITQSLATRFLHFFGSNWSLQKNPQLVNLTNNAINDTEKLIELIHQCLHRLNNAKGRQEFEDFFDLYKQELTMIDNGAVFHYEEGVLLKAMRHGHWILLDEINLAPQDVLQTIHGVLASKHEEDVVNIIGESGQLIQLSKHPNFRLFACMNPGTDHGKKDLPPFLKRHFISMEVPEMDTDLDEFTKFIGTALGRDFIQVLPDADRNAAALYIECKQLINDRKLVSSEGIRPILNLRALVRALRYARDMCLAFGHLRALYEGFLLFATSLDQPSQSTFTQVLQRHLTLHQKYLKNALSWPDCILYAGYPILKGCQKCCSLEILKQEFIITSTIQVTLENVSRALTARTYPILLEGPTSVGKTSLLHFLAQLSGNHLVRLNNHEHTDLADYIGNFHLDAHGKMYFKEGTLVKALKTGSWILLDELNLAPSEVLEALNRLLDDNRELFIVETGERIKPHPNFVLFATQNPAGSMYGGRKHLSRAFRSRFLEIQVPSIPIMEVQEILQKKCKIAPSQAKKLCSVYETLQEKRCALGSNIFLGRDALMSMRDLFKWASRVHDLTEDLALSGIQVLAERCRTKEERQLVIEVIQQVFKLDNILIQNFGLYDVSLTKAPLSLTLGMRRMFLLCSRAIENREPVLLVGETGCGKTSVCQLLSWFLHRAMISVSCHQNTEPSDLLGAFRPNRSSNTGPLFEFYEGPLVQAMRTGSILLLDEISLAEDSVLEALNPVLEFERTLTLCNSHNNEPEVLKAHDQFCLIATMNPGGDYGKRELSPALRSRFTEIWVPDDFIFEDLLMLLDNNVHVAEMFMWLKGKIIVSLRDVYNYSVAIKVKSTILDIMDMIFFDRFADSALRQEFCGHFSLDQVVPVDESSLPCIVELKAPTTRIAAHRILRAMNCLRKPVMLEGPPGVGKSTLIAALARSLNSQLVRINLSEQTDLADLFGTELPANSEGVRGFSWCDGPLLRAIQCGYWVLLDEINLASQAVIEGLNALLDHRENVYIPELDRTFSIHPDTRIFACQNPHMQGGNRKGLPKSFLNRFTIVWFPELTLIDYEIILVNRYPLFDSSLIHKAITFINELSTLSKSFLFGNPWELNLRDLYRWFSICPFESPLDIIEGFSKFVRPLIISRFRSFQDRKCVLELFNRIFERHLCLAIPFDLQDNQLHIGEVSIYCSENPSLLPLPFQMTALEALIVTQSDRLTLLTGTSGLGKSTLVRFLAKLCGQSSVKEVTCTPESDVLELLGSFEQTDMGSFAWRDGPLVQACEQGSWIVLNQANFASAAVLDRLNCLFEPEGELPLPEQGPTGMGEMRNVKPKPGFKCFLVYDPKFGEISRAMRNRGVEIFLDHQDVDSLDNVKLGPINRLPLAAFDNGNEISQWYSQHPITHSFSKQSFIDQMSALYLPQDLNQWYHPWTIEHLLTKPFIYPNNLNLVRYALNHKGYPDLVIEAPKIYELWMKEYRPLKSTFHVPSVIEDTTLGAFSLKRLQILTELSTTSPKPTIVDKFWLNSKIFENFSLSDLSVIVNHSCLQVILTDVFESLKNACLIQYDQIDSFMDTVKKECIGLSCLEGQVSDYNIIFEDIENAMDFNEIWENRLIAKQCVYEVLKDELFHRECFLTYYLGSPFTEDALKPSHYQLAALKLQIDRLHEKRLNRCPKERVAFGHLMQGLRHFHTNRNYEMLKDIRLQLAQLHSYGDMVFLLCNLMIDPMLWSYAASQTHKATGPFIMTSLSSDILTGTAHPRYLLAQFNGLPSSTNADKSGMDYQEKSEEQQEREIYEQFFNQLSFEHVSPSVIEARSELILNALMSWNVPTSKQYLESYGEHAVFDLIHHKPMPDIMSRLYGLYKIQQCQDHPDLPLSLLKRCRHLLTLMQIDCRQFLMDFPEQDSLMEIDRLSDQILQHRAPSSVISLSLHLERIAIRIDDWLRCNQRKFGQKDELIDLILECRSREVQQWPALFEKLHAQSIDQGEFVRFTCMLLQQVEPSIDLIDVIDGFLLMGPSGTYPARLSLVTGLIYNVHANVQPLIKLVTLYHQTQVLPIITQFLDTNCGSLRHDLKLYAATCKWSDRNLYSLQTSIQKSHLFVSKYLCKFKGILNRPASVVLSSTGLNPKNVNSEVKVHPLLNDFLNELKSLNLQDSTLSVQDKQATLISIFKALKAMGFRLSINLTPLTLRDSLLALAEGCQSELLDDSLQCHAIEALSAWNRLETILSNVSNKQVLEQVGPTTIQMARSVMTQLCSCLIELVCQFYHQANPFQYYSNVVGIMYIYETRTRLSSSLKQMSDSYLLCHDNNMLQALLSFTPLNVNGTSYFALSKAQADILIQSGHFPEPDVIIQPPSSELFSITTLEKLNIHQLGDIQSLLEKHLLLSSLSYLCIIFGNLFGKLFSEGFGHIPKEESTTTDMKEGEEEQTDGTGMADLDGPSENTDDMQNVSKELEFEEQITDLQGQNKDENKPIDEKGEEEHDHVQMENDFEAQLQDLIDQEQEEPPEEEEGEEKENDISNEQVDTKGGKETPMSGSDGSDDEKLPDADQAPDRSAENGEIIYANEPEDKLEEAKSDDEKPSKDKSDLEDDDLPENMNIDEDSAEEDEEHIDGAMEPLSTPDEPDPTENRQEEQEKIDAFEYSTVDQIIPEHQQFTYIEEMPGVGVIEDLADQTQDNMDVAPEAKKSKTLDALGTGSFTRGKHSSMNKDPQNNVGKRSSFSENQEGIERKGPIHKSLHDIMSEELPFDDEKVDDVPLKDKSSFSTLQQYHFAQPKDRDAVQVQSEYGQANDGALADDMLEQEAEGLANDYDDEKENDFESDQNLVSGKQKTTSSIPNGPELAQIASEKEMTWSQMCKLMEPLSMKLAEQLRLTLVPTIAGRLKGDYKTGKRLNVRKIIPFIASGYRRDKIWLRRTKPSKRNYRVMLCIDNSQSMQHSGADLLALQAATLIDLALNKLDNNNASSSSGSSNNSNSGCSIISFGETVRKFNLQSDGDLKSFFSFNEQHTDLLACVNYLNNASTSMYTTTATIAKEGVQLNVFISDGIFSMDLRQIKERFMGKSSSSSSPSENQREQNAAAAANLFVIVDQRLGTPESITELTQVSKDIITGKLSCHKYLRDFPFDHYVIVKDLHSLPDLLSEAVRQWFRMFSSNSS